LTRGSAEIDIIRKILIHNNSYKWKRSYESNDVCPKENTYFGDIPMEKVFIEKENIQKNPLEIAEIGRHK
jgi:hypothetical protein